MPKLVNGKVQFAPVIVAGMKSVAGALFLKTWQRTCVATNGETMLPPKMTVRLVTWALAAGEVIVILPGAVFEISVSVNVKPGVMTNANSCCIAAPVPLFHDRKDSPGPGFAPSLYRAPTAK